MAAFIIELETEEIVRGALRDTAVGPYLVLEDWQTERLLSQFRQIHSSIASGQSRPVILGSDIRRFVRGFLTRNGIDLPVLSYQDLASDFTIQPVGSVKLTAAKENGLSAEPRG
ncbi:type III secretory pathway component EscV [Bradyrhizobium sp. i1.4.4]